MKLSSLCVDVHAHALTAEFIDGVGHILPKKAPRLHAADGGVELVYESGGRRGPFPTSFVDPEARLADMARAGVDVQVLSSPPFMFLYDQEAGRAAQLASILNDSLVAWARFRPDTFRVLASLPAQDVGLAIREVERVVAEPLIAGIALGSNIAGKDLDDPTLAPMWQVLAAAGLPVLVHPVDAPGDRLARYFMRNIVGNPVDTTIAAACLIFGGVLEDNPALRVCLVHGGGFLPYQLGRLERGYLQRADVRRHASRSPRSFLPQLYFDTILHDASALRFMAEQVGWERIVIGTDFPFEMGDLQPDLTIGGMKLGASELRLVRSENAKRFLRGLE